MILTTTLLILNVFFAGLNLFCFCANGKGSNLFSGVTGLAAAALCVVTLVYGGA